MWSFRTSVFSICQYIRQSIEITGVPHGLGEQKFAPFADDILIFLTNPTESFSNVMRLLDDYGFLSGHKININKTQVLKLNYQLKLKTHINGTGTQTTSNIWCLTEDPTKLFEANYDPLLSMIKKDLQRWKTVPLLTLQSRVESIRMNVLPRLLYLFQSLAIWIPQEHFEVWRNIGQVNKRARIKYKTMQLLEEKGGISLQCLRDYYYAAQLRPLMCLCSPTYSSVVPIMALLADKKENWHLGWFYGRFSPG